MGWILVCVCSALVLMLLVELVVLHRRVNELPLATWSVLKQHAEDQAAVEEAVVKKTAALLVGIRKYHDELASELRAQATNAELRAKVIERRSMDAGVALDAASHLVAQLRAMLDAHEPAAAPHVAAGLGPRPVSSTRPHPHPPPKRTLLGIRPPPPDEGEPEEEPTCVVDRPEFPRRLPKE